MSAPYSTAITTAGVKGVASDLFAQVVVERRARLQDLSLSRTMAFASFGCLYCGLFASWKYNTLYTSLFGASTTLSVISSKISMDMLCSAPLVYFPTYFIVKGLFNGQSPLASVKEFLKPAGRKMLTQYWMVWLPVEVVMWTLIPAHLRIAFICAVSLIWQVFLSTMSFRKDVAAAEEEPDECPLTYDSFSSASYVDADGSIQAQRSCIPIMTGTS